jgi:hypothetical protein
MVLRDEKLKLMPIMREKINFPMGRKFLTIMRSNDFRWRKCSSKRHNLIERP